MKAPFLRKLSLVVGILFSQMMVKSPLAGPQGILSVEWTKKAQDMRHNFKLWFGS
jgi:hypothetical protein